MSGLQPPDAPDIWSNDPPPGGYVCAACGVLTESGPCGEHQPAASDQRIVLAQDECGRLTIDRRCRGHSDEEEPDGSDEGATPNSRRVALRWLSNDADELGDYTEADQ